MDKTPCQVCRGIHNITPNSVSSIQIYSSNRSSNSSSNRSAIDPDQADKQSEASREITGDSSLLSKVSETERKIKLVQELHHSYLEANIPVLKDLVKSLRPQIKDKSFEELADIVEMLCHRLGSHAREEDDSIFPMLLEVANGRKDDTAKNFIEDIVEAHRIENETIWRMLAQLCKGSALLKEKHKKQELEELYLHIADLKENMIGHLEKEVDLYPELLQMLGLEVIPLARLRLPFQQ